MYPPIFSPKGGGINRGFHLLQNTKVALSFLRFSGSCSKNISAFLALVGVHEWCLKDSIDFYSSATWTTSVPRNSITIAKTYMGSSQPFYLNTIMGSLCPTPLDYISLKKNVHQKLFIGSFYLFLMVIRHVPSSQNLGSGSNHLCHHWADFITAKIKTSEI